MEHVAGLTVGGKGSIDLGRELRAAVKDRTCKVHGVPRVLVLLLVWHLIASFWVAGRWRGVLLVAFCLNATLDQEQHCWPSRQKDHGGRFFLSEGHCSRDARKSEVQNCEVG
jgi:hypothetical protein